MSGFTHFNEDGNAVMVDVGEKAETKREALASGMIRMSEECFQKVKEGSMKKGDVLFTGTLLFSCILFVFGFLIVDGS